MCTLDTVYVKEGCSVIIEVIKQGPDAATVRKFYNCLLVCCFMGEIVDLCENWRLQTKRSMKSFKHN